MASDGGPPGAAAANGDTAEVAGADTSEACANTSEATGADTARTGSTHDRSTRSHRIGAAAMLASGVGFGMSGVFIRNLDADNWQIASWRGLIGSLGVLLYVLLRRRRRLTRPRLQVGMAAGAQVLVLMSFGALSMYLFVTALQKTAVANVSVIMATIPFMAATLAWLLLRERLRRLTVLASLVSFAGVILTVTGSFGGGDLEGDLYALCLSLSLASLIVFIRRFGAADALLAQVGAGVVLFAVALAVGDPFGLARDQVPLILVFGVVYAVSLILWTEGIRLIPAAEAGLLATSETPSSIMLAWIFVGEAPPLATVLGGLLVLGSVLGLAGADLAHDRVSRPWLRPRARMRL